MSVGVVADHDYLFKDRASKDPETIYFEEVAKAPGLQPRIKNATRCDIFRIQKEYTYRTKQGAGDGWVPHRRRLRLPRPALFVGSPARAHFRAAWPRTASPRRSRRTTSPRRSSASGRSRSCEGIDRIRRLVCEYYDGLSFGRFVKKHPHLKGLVTDVLIGDVFKDEVDVLWPLMDEMRKEQGIPPYQSVG